MSSSTRQLLPRALVAGLAVAALALAACSPAPAPDPTAQPAATATRPAAAAKPAASPAASGSVADRLKTVAGAIDQAVSAVDAGDLQKASSAYEEFDEGWERVEDDVKAKSPTAYRAIEDAMDGVKAALTKADKPDATKAREALTKLKQTIDANLAALA